MTVKGSVFAKSMSLKAKTFAESGDFARRNAMAKPAE